jgi:hypothetical protein
MEEEITALLASVAGGRRYWVRAPQDAARPFVVLNRITGIIDYQMNGPSGYVSSRIQADCYADTYSATKATARAVKTVLSGYNGGTIQGAFIDNERDLPASDAGEVTNLFRTELDILVHHQA